MDTDCQRLSSCRRGVLLSGIVFAGLVTCGPAWAQIGGVPADIAAPTSSAPVSGPQLSIAVADGRESVVAGDRLGYTVTVRNLGSTNLTGLQVSQTVPAGAVVKSVDSAGVAGHGAIRWRVRVKPAATVVLHATMAVGETPPDLLRLASVACATIGGDGRPIVCATHSDELPAGAAEAAGSSGMTTVTMTARQGWWYAAAGITVLLLGFLVAMVLRLRKRHRPL